MTSCDPHIRQFTKKGEEEKVVQAPSSIHGNNVDDVDNGKSCCYSVSYHGDMQ